MSGETAEPRPDVQILEATWRSFGRPLGELVMEIDQIPDHELAWAFRDLRGSYADPGPGACCFSGSRVIIPCHQDRARSLASVFRDSWWPAAVRRRSARISDEARREAQLGNKRKLLAT